MASTKKKVDRTAAIRAAAERVRAAALEEAAKESPYGGMSLAERNIVEARPDYLRRRPVEVAPVRDIDPSTYVPQPTKKLPPIYGVTDTPAPRQSASAASSPSPAQSRADFVEQALQSAKRKKREASAAPRLPSGAKAGPAVEQAAAALVQPSKPKARPTPKPAPSPEPSKAPAKKATKQVAKKAAKPATPPPAKKAAKKAPAKKAAAPAKKAVPKPAAKKAAAPAPAPAKAAPAPQAAPAAPPANAPAPRRLPRFGAGAWFGLGALANAAAGFYDSYTREKARKERKGK